MPSSLTSFHSFTLGYSPYPPVSVYGTDARSDSQQKLFLHVDSRKLGIGLPRALVLRSRFPYTFERSIHKTARASFQGPWLLQRI